MRRSTSGPPVVSVVIPIYNGERHIRETVESALRQQGVDALEVVLVDDGSTDASHEIVSAIPDSRIRLFRQENRGIAGARNTGIRNSRGRYVAFLDQDDLWRPDKLSVQLPEFERSPRVGLVYCKVARVDGEGQRVGPGPTVFAPHLSGDVRARILVTNLVPGTASVVVRRECFDQVGYFDEQLAGADDWEMWSRISTRYEFRFLNRELCYFRLHGSNASLNVEHMRRDCLRVQAKLFDNRELLRGFSPRKVKRLRRLSTARIHHYCATWLISTDRVREGVSELWIALKLHPTRPRHLVLLLFSLLGWFPGPLRKRLT